MNDGYPAQIVAHTKKAKVRTFRVKFVDFGEQRLHTFAGGSWKYEHMNIYG